MPAYQTDFIANKTNSLFVWVWLFDFYTTLQGGRANVTLVLLGEFKNIRNNNRKLYTQMSEPNIFVDTI